MAHVNYYIKFDSMTVPYLNVPVKLDSEIVNFVLFCKSEGAIAIEVEVQNGKSWIERF